MGFAPMLELIIPIIFLLFLIYVLWLATKKSKFAAWLFNYFFNFNKPEESLPAIDRIIKYIRGTNLLSNKITDEEIRKALLALLKKDAQ